MSSSVTSPYGVRPSNVAALTVRLRSATGPSFAGAKTSGGASGATRVRLEQVSVLVAGSGLESRLHCTPRVLRTQPQQCDHREDRGDEAVADAAARPDGGLREPVVLDQAQGADRD